MKNKILIIIFGIVFVSGFIGTAHAVVAEEYVNVPSPREQLKNGIEPEDITCKIGHVLALKPSGTPACVWQNTADKLGWKTIKIQFDYSAYKEEERPDRHESTTSDVQYPQRILNPEPEEDEHFGSSVAIGDGVLAIGVPHDNSDDTHNDAGAVYLYDMSSRHLIQAIHNPEPERGDLFGSSVAIDDGVLAIGAEGDDLPEQHILSLKTNLGYAQWLQVVHPASGTGTVRITDPDMNFDSMAADSFDVDVWSGSDAEGIDLTVTETGNATGVFEGTVSFSTDDESSGHRLVVAEGDTITAAYKDSTLPYPYTAIGELDIVSTSTIGPVDDSSYAGSVYLYDVESGERMHVIHNPEPELGAKFGSYVDIHNKILAIKTSDTGSVYAYDVKSGKRMHVIHNPEPELGAKFGSYVAIGDGALAIGIQGNGKYSTYDDDYAGSVYLYDVESGERMHVIHNPEPGNLDRPGNNYVGIGDGVLAIGVPHNIRDDADSIYLYDVKLGERTRVIRHNPESDSYYRYGNMPLVINDGVLAIGVSEDGNGSIDNTGSVYLYETASRNQIPGVHNPEPEVHDRFGSSVAIGDGVLAVGVPGDNNDGVYRIGSVYLYDVESLIQNKQHNSTDN